MRIDDLRLIGDRVLVRPDPKEDRSEGGLVIPETVLADNPNFYYVSGVVVKLGDGVREDIYECLNQQCRYQSRRTAGETCPICKATQRLAYHGTARQAFDVKVGDRIHFGRFAGKQVEVELPDVESNVLELDGSVMLGQIPHMREAFGWQRPKAKFLIMREVEIRGVLTDQARVTPGYEAASRGRVSTGLSPV